MAEIDFNSRCDQIMKGRGFQTNRELDRR